jgi:hypothetical protein
MLQAFAEMVAELLTPVIALLLALFVAGIVRLGLGGD